MIEFLTAKTMKSPQIMIPVYVNNNVRDSFLKSKSHLLFNTIVHLSKWDLYFSEFQNWVMIIFKTILSRFNIIYYFQMIFITEKDK